MKEYKEQMQQVQYLQLKLEDKQHLRHPYVVKLNENSSETITTIEAE